MLAELCDQCEDGIVQDVTRDIVVSLLLISNVNQAVVNSHLELCRGFELPALILVELL